jgi:hypothetical protein
MLTDKHQSHIPPLTKGRIQVGLMSTTPKPLLEKEGDSLVPLSLPKEGPED